jgi:YihY family inner membrane protein
MIGRAIANRQAGYESVVAGDVSSVHQLVGRIDAAQRRHKLLALPVAVFKKFGDDQAGKLASQIAYYGFFSLFPLLLVMVTVLGYVLVGHPGLQKDLLDSALTQFPVVGKQLEVSSLRGNPAALTIGIVGALWAGLAALQAMENAMNDVWDVPIKDRPNFIMSRLRAALLLVVLGAGVVGVVALSAIGAYSRRLGFAGNVVSLALALALATGVFLLAFRVLPNRELSWSTLLPGALVASAGFVVLQMIGSFYVSRVVKGASESYGVFAIVIGLLSWMHLLAQVVLLAAEVNVVRDERLWPRSLHGDDITEADERALCRYAKVEERRDDEEIAMLLDNPHQ